jgi:hypothetical protein
MISLCASRSGTLPGLSGELNSRHVSFHRAGFLCVAAFVLVGLTTDGFSGCSGPGDASISMLTASLSSINFGEVVVGSNSSQTIRMSHQGSANLTVSRATGAEAGFSISGLNSTFMITAGKSTIFNVAFPPSSTGSASAAGESVPLTVTFAPTAAGSVTGSVTITSYATNSPTNISLSRAIVPQTPDATIPSTFFGMHLAYGPTGYSTPILAPIQVGAMGKPPGTNWEYIETARGTYNWTNLDSAVAHAQRQGIPIFESHEWVPQWAASVPARCGFFNKTYHCDSAPTDLNTIAACQAPLAEVKTTDCMWKEFLTSIVNRYKPTGIQTGCSSSNPQCHGVIQMYEGWNEPPFSPPGGSGTLSNADFMTFETDFYNTVKFIDSATQVCSPAFEIYPSGSQGDLFNKAFFSGSPPNFDCWDFHIIDASPENQLADIRFLYGEGFPTGKLMYATEAGRWGGCNTTPSPPLTPGAYIARIELLYWTWGVKRHYWFGNDTCVPLTNQPTTPTLTSAGIAYGNVESWMVGATMSTPCASNGTVWTCGLSRPNGYEALAVWNTAGTSTFAAPSPYTQYQDLEGKRHSISGSVTIGPLPILLTLGAAPQATVH